MDQSFNQIPLSSELKLVLSELGYTAPTPIQLQAIPLLLEGHDLIGQSKTGSGKTAAFALPMLQKIELNKKFPQALILAPTRELCTQVAQEIRKLGRRLPGLQVLIVSGGQPIFSQINALERGVHIIVGTPGRVLDHLGRGTLPLHRIQTVILDEADRMLEMGFEEDMNTIISELPPNRQSVLFSATFPSNIEKLSHKLQKKPKRITIEEPQNTESTITQIFYQAHHNLLTEKTQKLLWVLKNYSNSKSIIIFCNQKTTVADVSKQLRSAGVSATHMSGDLEQWERDRVMAKFRNGSIRALVATDVAARGIDISTLDLVINYELPPQAEVYIHRIGRTGRAGREGLSISFTNDERKLLEISSLMNCEIQLEEAGEVSLEEFKANYSQPSPMSTLWIGAGRKDKLRPGDILGALTGESGGLKSDEVGKIEIHDRFAFVAIQQPRASHAHQCLQNGKIKGRKIRVEWA